MAEKKLINGNYLDDRIAAAVHHSAQVNEPMVRANMYDFINLKRKYIIPHTHDYEFSHDPLMYKGFLRMFRHALPAHASLWIWMPSSWLTEATIVRAVNARVTRPTSADRARRNQERLERNARNERVRHEYHIDSDGNHTRSEVITRTHVVKPKRITPPRTRQRFFNSSGDVVNPGLITPIAGDILPYSVSNVHDCHPYQGQT